jgi:hypothetical protein
VIAAFLFLILSHLSVYGLLFAFCCKARFVLVLGLGIGACIHTHTHTHAHTDVSWEGLYSCISEVA